VAPSSPIVGIDLGTTNSVIGIVEGGKVRLFENPLGETLTPSAVARDPKTRKLIVGRSAKDLVAADPASGAIRFKVDIGQTKTRSLGDSSLDPVALSACVLDALRADAERALGVPVARCVVTVPAYFDDSQRHATYRAAELAGFAVERVLNEPTAAAIAYGLHRRNDETLFAVVDLGGGTFDVCVMELFEGVLQVRGVAGDGRLGGDDFTLALAELVANQAGIGMPEAGTVPFGLLLRRAEIAKRALSRWATTQVELPAAITGRDACVVTISEAEASRTWVPLLDRIHGPLRAALRGAGVQRDQLAEVVLVGGATRMSCITRAVADIFGRKPLHHGDPDLLVAEGAAIQAALIAEDAAVSDLVVTDVASHSLGVDAAREIGHRHVPGFFVPIIHRNTVIPTSRWEIFNTIGDDQKEIHFGVYEGEARRVSDNRKIGELRVRGLPRKPAGLEVRVRFTYDHNGMLEVEAEVPQSGQKATKVFHRLRGELAGAELNGARARLRALRADPMDRPLYRDLHARASVLWQEAPAMEREILGALMDALEAAADGRNPAEVERAYQALLRHCETVDGNERW